MTLNDFYDRYFSIHVDVSAGYEASIRSAIRAFGNHLGRVARIGDLSDKTLQQFSACRLGAGISRASINRELRTLLRLARVARKQYRFTKYRPDVQMLPEKRQRPTSWRLKDVEAILAAIYQVYGATYWGRILKAVTLVAYDTGLRIIDIVNAQKAECSLSRLVVSVTEQKTGKFAARTIHADTAVAIAEAWEASEPLDRMTTRFLPYRFKETQPLRKRLRGALESAKMPSDSKSLWHRFRKTTANLGDAAGVDPMKIGNWSSLQVWHEFYRDESIAPPLDIANRLPRPKTG